MAASVRADYPDGVWVIELASVGAPGAVPESVAAALGIVQQPGLSLTESIAGALEGRNRLLLFDNCEHVLDAAADVIESIITTTDTLRVLATSREGLRLPDERIHPVPSLDVRAGADSAAVALFFERANAAGSEAILDGVDDLVVDICRRLDGIPLAIELAASRTQSMTVPELRDRLDDRFRLLVGSRRGLPRHQTLRHAVKWSVDLLDEPEYALLQSCSVFAGGFDLMAACAVGGGDEYDTMDLLDSLVRKSLVVADRTAQHTRFSILETVRQFAEEQLADGGRASDARAAHARYYASRESFVLAMWDGPQQREAYAWFNAELANLRNAFRWSADYGELDVAVTIAVYATFLGWWTDHHEPIVWAEELIEKASAAEHPRLAQLYVMAAQCFAAGRTDESIRYAEAAMAAITSGRYDVVPFGFDASVGGAYMARGQTDLAVRWCEGVAARGGHRHMYVNAILSLGYMLAGDFERARATSAELRAAADLTSNPEFACFALMAYALPRRATDPAAAIEVHRRGLHIARSTANRQLESHFASGLAQVLIKHGDADEAFGLIGLAIRNFYDSGGFSRLQAPLAALVDLLDRQNCYESGAVIAGFADSPFARSAYPEIITAIAHLRDVLGEREYQACRRRGAELTNAAMSTYALDQIDRARALI